MIDDFDGVMSCTSRVEFLKRISAMVRELHDEYSENPEIQRLKIAKTVSLLNKKDNVPETFESYKALAEGSGL